ncbi:hypothetical protein L596_027613 [Steinernema carpocapsae]|uniref:Uncharacterized protein n=1 Tax=Steinernema carpocapsae TaxID=34508 RepID=A0A4U5LW13_STECR|nr:hypothetical protein L596_027613 [Steinernema carpocapsae]
MDELCSRLVQRRKTLGHLEPTEEEEDKNLNSLKGSFPSTSTSTLSTISSISSSNCSTRSAPPIVIRDPKLSPPPPPDVSEFKSKKFDLKAGKAGKIRERSKSVFIGTSQRNDVMEELKQRLDTKRKSVILSIERIEEESTEKKLPNGDVTHASLDILHQKAKNPKAVLHPIKIETQFGKASASNSVSPNHSAPEAVKKAIPPKPADSMMNVVVNKIQTLKVSHQSIKITNRAKSSKNVR